MCCIFLILRLLFPVAVTVLFLSDREAVLHSCTDFCCLPTP